VFPVILVTSYAFILVENIIVIIANNVLKCNSIN
jgi:hypothetical protein